MAVRQRVKNAWRELTKSDRETIELNQLYRFLGIDPDKNKNALSEATYFACMKVLSEAVGKLPLRLLRYNEKNGVEVAREHPLYNICRTRPNQYMTGSTFWSSVEYNRNHWGDSIVWIQGAGNDTKLWLLPRNDVEIWYDDAKILAEQPDIYYRYSHGGNTITFGSEEVLHFKTSNTLDGLVGISVQDQLKMSITGGIDSQKLLNTMYSNGYTGKAVVQYTGSLNEQNQRTFAKGIQKFLDGELKADGIKNVIPVPFGSTVQPLNLKLSDNQFMEIRQYTALQIASAFGIKPYQIGDYTKSSYASAEAQQLSFYVDTLLYILKQYEEELTFKLLSPDEIAKGYHFKFNIASILRTDLATQVDTIVKGIAGGLYTPNEGRGYMDLEAKEGGDVLLCNGASIPVKLTGSQYISNPEDTTKPPEETGEEGGQDNG